MALILPMARSSGARDESSDGRLERDRQRLPAAEWTDYSKLGPLEKEMNRSLCLSFALLFSSACGSAAPSSQPPPAGAAQTEPAPRPAAETPSASTAEPAAAASGAAVAAPADEAPKPPAPSTTRKAVLADQIKGTPLAVLNVTDAAAATCGAKPAEGSTVLELSLYWKPGTYEIGTRTKTASIRVRQFEGGKWKTLPDVVKGQVQVIEAAVEPGKTGRLHITGDRAGQPINEDLEVVVCVPFDASKK
jgi:hypothetical protein